MIRKIKDTFFNKNQTPTERLFRVVLIIAACLTIAGSIETTYVMENADILLMTVPVGILIVVMYILAYKFGKFNIAANLSAIALNLIILPVLYFFCGGMNTGMPVWFVLGFLYVCMMFSDARLYVFLGLTLLADGSVIYIGEKNPQWISTTIVSGGSYVDLLFSALCVALAGGSFLSFYRKVYREESELVTKQKEELTKISKSKENYFVSMSHEFRTPINSIIGLNELILRKNENEEVNEYAMGVKNASNVLLELINDVLDLSKLDMGKMQIVETPYHTKEFLKNIIDMVEPAIKKKDIEFQVEIDEDLPSVIEGDEKRVRQVLLNLLSNAIKYTNKGTILLQVKGNTTKRDTIKLFIKVEDTGIGIRQEEIGHLYDSFLRINAREVHNIEGSGLGLAITKRILDAMGGEILVDSIYTKGTTFTVTLEQKIIDEKPMGSFELLEEMAKSPFINQNQRTFEAPDARILVVDDNDINGTVIRKLLENTKVQVDVVRSGKECLKKTMEKIYHVILMDYYMPDMDGGAVCAQIRKQGNGLCKDSAIIMLSAKSVAEMQNVENANNFDGFIEKPIQIERLEESILQLLPEELIEYCREDLLNQYEEKQAYGVISRNSRRKKKVIITTDCISDLPEGISESMDVRIMYNYIATPNGRFTDAREIDADHLNRFAPITETSVYAIVADVEAYEQFFAEILLEADDIIHIAFAKHIGEGYERAKEAAKCFDHVQVVDAGHISCGQSLVAISAAKMANDNMDKDEILKNLSCLKKEVQSSFILASSVTLLKNGYIHKRTNTLFYALQACPELITKNSKFVIARLYTGSLENVWKKYIRRHFRNNRKICNKILIITCSGCSVSQQNFILDEIEKYITFEQIFIQKATVSVACNAGMNAFGIAYYSKEIEDWT